MPVPNGTTDGTVTLSFPNAPSTGTIINTYARFRLATGTTGSSPTGSATNGEVEDYPVVINPSGIASLDWGDAPSSYPTLSADSGARHAIVSGVYLGAGVDAESDGIPGTSATGDDNANTDDEDGVVFTTRLTPGQNATIKVTASTPGFLNAWIDWNGDGSWTTSGDKIFPTDQPLTTGVNTLTFPVPSGLTTTVTYARFRFNSTTTGTGPGDVAHGPGGRRRSGGLPRQPAGDSDPGLAGRLPRL